jgi:Ca2+-binding RTX toxin-like protein
VVTQKFTPLIPQSASGAIIHGGNGGEDLPGTAGNDVIQGGNGKDLLRGDAGDDRIDGGDGVDTALYVGALGQYSITRTADGYVVSGPDGTDTLSNVERLQFADVKVAIDDHGSGGEAFRLYQAAFDRAPDHGGLGFWIDSLDAGVPLTQVSQLFMDSPEFRGRYGDPDAATFVTLLYQNVLHRGPDDTGKAYWVDHLAHADLSRADTLMLFSESPENQAALIGTISHGMVYGS